MDTNNKFSLALVKGAEFDAMPCIDVFSIKVDGVSTIELSFDYCSDDPDGAMVAMVKSLTGDRPEDLPGIYNAFQLIGMVDAMLADVLSQSGCEFYAELFFDERGGAIELPIDFAALCKQPALLH